MPADENYITITAKVPPELVKALKESAKRADRTASAEVRRALRQYLERPMRRN
jgi:predicted transcriptional regulator